MSRLWSCGFELQSATSGIEWDTTVGSPSISTTTKRSGAAALRCNPTAATSYGQHRYRANNTPRVHHRMYFRFDTFPNTTVAIMAFSDGSAVFPSIRFESGTNTLAVYDLNNIKVGSSSAALVLGQWYRLELSYLDGFGGGDQTSAYLDGVAFASNVQAGDMFGGDVFMFGILASATADMYIDDIAVNDDTGTAQTGLPGSGQIVHLKPNAAGDANGFATAVGGTAGAANNFTRVSEITPDDSTSYNQTTATGTTTIDDFNVTDSSTAGIGAADSITLVQVGARIGSNAATAASIVTRIKGQASGTTTESASTSVAVSGWSTHALATPKVHAITAYTNPQTSTAWTPTTLDSLQIGYRGDVSQTTQRRITTLWTLVEYVTAVATDYAGPYRGPTPGRNSPTGLFRPQPPGLAKPAAVVLVGAAAQTDAALALGLLKTRALGVAAETDSAVAVGRAKTRAVNIAAETDTAVPVGRVKVRALGVAAEADTAPAVSRSHSRTLGVAGETDTAQAIGRRKTKTVSSAAETDAAIALTRSHSRALGAAGETDTAQPLGRIETKTLNAAAETDSAQPLGRRKTKPIASATSSTTVRDFDGAGSTRIETAAGGLAAITPTAHAVTLAFLWKPSGTSDDGLLRIQGSSGTLIYGVNPFGGNLYLSVGGAGFDASPYTYTGSDGWRLDVVTRTAGFTGQVRWHGYRLSVGSWTHTDGGTKSDPNNTGGADSVYLGALDGSNTLDGELAVVGVWLSALSDVAVETLPASLQAWADLSPGALWALNQTSISDPVVDLTGGGADETGDAGTSVVTGDAPPGFDFTFGGPPVEVDAALPLGRRHTATVGVAVETDIAAPVSGATAAQQAQPYAGPWTAPTPGWQSPTGQLSVRFGDASATVVHTVPVGVAAETDTAVALGRAKTRLVGVAVDSDAALPLGRSHTRTVGAASGTDTAVPVGRRHARTVGAALESDAAVSVGGRHVRAVGVVAESDSALPVGRFHTRSIGVAATTDTAGTIGRAKRRLIGVSSSSDVALPVGTPGELVGAAGTASTTDAALPVGKAKRGAVATASASDTALPVGRVKVRAVGVAVAVDSAAVIAGRHTRALGVASTTDTAIAVGRAMFRIVGTASTTDVALPVGSIKVRSVGTASTSDIAMAVSGGGGVVQLRPGVLTAGTRRSRLVAGGGRSHLTAGTARGPSYTSGG